MLSGYKVKNIYNPVLTIDYVLSESEDRFSQYFIRLDTELFYKNLIDNIYKFNHLTLKFEIFYDYPYLVSIREKEDIVPASITEIERSLSRKLNSINTIFRSEGFLFNTSSKITSIFRQCRPSSKTIREVISKLESNIEKIRSKYPEFFI